MSVTVAWNNLADLSTTTLSAQGAETLTPVSNLLNPHVGKKWRHNAASTYVLADLGSSQLVDTVMLAGLNLTAPTVRVRLSSTSGSPDNFGTTGDVADSGSLPYANWFYDTNSGLLALIGLATSPCRYVRIDISQGSASYIEAGRIFAGSSNTFATGPQAPYTRAFVRGSVDSIGVGGQTFVDLRKGHRTLAFNFTFVSETERSGFLESMGARIANVGHLDALWIMGLPLDAIWGYVDGEFRLTQSIYGPSPAVYSAEFLVRERL